jgi:hypothetical protein
MILSEDLQYCKCGCKTIIPKYSVWGRKLNYSNGHNKLAYMYDEEERRQKRKIQIKP